MTFRVGQKVACVSTRQYHGYAWSPFADIPVVGEIYTVTALFIHDGEDGVILREIKNATPEGGYRASRFRPIVERKTDISIFKRMLLPQGVEAIG